MQAGLIYILTCGMSPFMADTKFCCIPVADEAKPDMLGLFIYYQHVIFQKCFMGTVPKYNQPLYCAMVSNTVNILVHWKMTFVEYISHY